MLISFAAINFSDSTSVFDDFLKEVDKSEGIDPNYPVLQEGIEKAIVFMETARCSYREIVKISESLEMDMVILIKLLLFDYNGLKYRYNFNPSIFEKAAAFCKAGYVKGIYTHTFDTIFAILENLKGIKSKIEIESLPELFLIGETVQLFFETEIFGQYISRIFYEINREVRGKF
jgi:hypothetical protein